MNFDMRRPCNNCPFLRSEQRVNLRRDRVAEITDSLLYGNTTFACHKTTVESDGEDGDLVATSDSQHCGGALIFVEKHTPKGHASSNQMLRIAERLRIYDVSRLDPAAFAGVFDSVEEMEETHAGATGD